MPNELANGVESKRLSTTPEQEKAAGIQVMARAFVNAVRRPPHFESLEDLVIERISGAKLDYAPDDMRADLEELIESLQDDSEDIIELSSSMSDLLSSEISDMLIQDFDSTLLSEEVDVPESIYSYNSLIFPNVKYAGEGTMFLSRDVAAVILPDLDIQSEEEETYILITPF